MTEKVKNIKVGIMPLEAFKKRTIAIALGKYRPGKNEPKIWFKSMKSLAHVLSEENQALLKLIAHTHPHSVNELESLTGRKANNLLRTLRTMENYGFVELLKGKKSRGKNPLVPQVVYNAANITLSFK